VKLELSDKVATNIVAESNELNILNRQYKTLHINGRNYFKSTRIKTVKSKAKILIYKMILQ
jgi:hypothetical protein